MGFKVLVTDLRHADIEREKRILSAIDAEVFTSLCDTEEEVINQGEDFDALLVSYTTIGKKVFSHLKRLKVVVKYGAGYDNIDIKAATEAGVVICNVRHHCIEEVSTHAFGLLLSAARRICLLNREVKEGIWREDPSPLGIRRIEGKTCGIVGLGRIGKRFAEKMEAFGTEILVYDPFIPDEYVEKLGYSIVKNLEELFRKSSFVSIHCPLNENTQGMISYSILSKAESLILVNTARGPIVDHRGLVRAMREYHVLFYTADVLSKEPPCSDEESLQYLLNSERVILTPHCAWYSSESENELISGAAEEVLNVLSGRQPKSVVNPEVFQKR